MAFADSDKLKQIIHENHYIVTDKINSQDYGMFTNGIEQAIEKATIADVVEIKDCCQCKHFKKHAGQYPCSHCRNCYTDKYEPKEGAEK